MLNVVIAEISMVLWLCGFPLPNITTSAHLLATRPGFNHSLQIPDKGELKYLHDKVPDDTNNQGASL